MKRAFSLIEVLVALALLGLLSGSLAAFFSSLSSRSAWVGQRAERARAGDVAVERLAAALDGAVVGGAGDGAGVRGDGASVRVLTRASLGPGRSDLAAFTLALRDGALVAEWADATTVHAISTEAFAGVGALGVRYYDQGAWRDGFDSAQAGRLPAAVEVSLWFGEAAPAGEDDQEPGAPERRADRRRVLSLPDAEVRP